MNPEYLHTPEVVASHEGEHAPETKTIHIAQVETVVRERIESLNNLTGKISVLTFERLAHKIASEHESLMKYVSNKERVQAAERAKAQDLDEQYFVKKRLNYSPL